MRLLGAVALAPKVSTSCTEMTAANRMVTFCRALGSTIAPIRAKAEMQRPSSGPGSGRRNARDVVMLLAVFSGLGDTAVRKLEPI